MSISRHIENNATSIDFDSTPEKVEAAVEKILSYCRFKAFTVREFAHLVDNLNTELETARNKAEINSLFGGEKSFAENMDEFKHSLPRRPFD